MSQEKREGQPGLSAHSDVGMDECETISCHRKAQQLGAPFSLGFSPFNTHYPLETVGVAAILVHINCSAYPSTI